MKPIFPLSLKVVAILFIVGGFSYSVWQLRVLTRPDVRALFNN